MRPSGPVVVALSGGVDSAVAALVLVEQGYDVECLHMTNWEDDDGYCQAAQDFQDARRTAASLGVTLHRVNFADEYYAQVFTEFLDEHRRGRTPNPDVLCNRRIKFGVMRDYALRLGAARLATGHYARLEHGPTGAQLLKAEDTAKDQTYFLHAIDGRALESTLFPLGDMNKATVRQRARAAGLPVADKRDSTGICFIGERPFAEFLSHYVADDPGPIVTPSGQHVGTHRGLAFYTLGQRQGLQIGGLRGHGASPWYVAAKRLEENTLVVVQGASHPLLFQNRVIASGLHWLSSPPPPFLIGEPVRCTAKTRYRQPDRACTVQRIDEDRVVAMFDEPERAVAPGQFIVFYSGEQCLGGARIDAASMHTGALADAV
jgi:tRNA-specific 2-thiouridylase